MRRSQALFRSQLNYLPTMDFGQISQLPLNWLLAVCGSVLKSPMYSLVRNRIQFVFWHSHIFFAFPSCFRFWAEGISFTPLSPDHPQRHFCSLSPQTNSAPPCLQFWYHGPDRKWRNCGLRPGTSQWGHNLE